MVLALNVSVYFCKLLPLHMNGNLPVGIGMHVFAMICDLIWPNRAPCCFGLSCIVVRVRADGRCFAVFLFVCPFMRKAVYM
eukprot:UN2075